MILLKTLALCSLAFLFLVSPTLALTGSDAAFYARGVELARSGKFDAALKELERAAELAPNNAKIHNMLGVVLTQLGRLNEAHKAYSRALALAPDFLPARKNRAVNSFRRGDLKFALGEFEALARLEPKDLVPHLFLGLLAIEEGGFPKAQKHLLEARQLSPGNTRVILALIKVHFALGERQRALELAGNMKNRSQLLDAERFDLGVILAQFAANAEAAEIFRELWSKNQGSYDIGFNLALTQYRGNQLESAQRTVEALGSSVKPSGELLNLRGWIYNKMRKLDEAQESIQMAISLEPDDADHYLDLSIVFINQGNIEAAIRVISEGLRRDVEKGRLLVQMGLLYEKKGGNNEAENWYRTALLSNPGNRSAYLALANLMLATGRREEALNLLVEATQFLPRDPLLHYMYGGQLLEADQETGLQQLEKAASILKKALELNPFYSNTHYMLGKLYLRKGDYPLAQSYFVKACAYKPDHTSAYYQLSLIARRQGKTEKAVELGRIVQMLKEKADKGFQESFSALVQESLGAAAKTVVHKSKE